MIIRYKLLNHPHWPLGTAGDAWGQYYRRGDGIKPSPRFHEQSRLCTIIDSKCHQLKQLALPPAKPKNVGLLHNYISVSPTWLMSQAVNVLQCTPCAPAKIQIIMRFFYFTFFLIFASAYMYWGPKIRIWNTHLFVRNMVISFMVIYVWSIIFMYCERVSGKNGSNQNLLIL